MNPEPDTLFLAIWRSIVEPDLDRTRLYASMRDAQVLVPVIEQPSPGTPLESLPVALLGCRGIPEYAGFTSLDALKRHNRIGTKKPHLDGDPPHVALPLRDLCRLVLLRGFHQVALNPNWALSYVMSLAEIEHVVGMGKVPEPWQQGIPMDGVLDAPRNDKAAEAIAKAVKAPDADQAPLYEAIRNGTFLVPCMERAEFDENGKVKGTVKLLPYADDRCTALMAFTDVPAFLRRFGHPNVYWVGINAWGICWAVLDGRYDGLSINMDGPHPLWIPAWECDAIMSGFTIHARGSYSLSDPSSIHALPAPQSPPTWLLDEFAQAAQRAGVAELRWLWYRVGDGYPHLGFAVGPWTNTVVAEMSPLLTSLYARYKDFTPFIDVFPMSLLTGREAESTLVYGRK